MRKLLWATAALAIASGWWVSHRAHGGRVAEQPSTKPSTANWMLSDYVHYGLWRIGVYEHPPSVYVTELIDELEEEPATTTLTDP